MTKGDSQVKAVFWFIKEYWKKGKNKMHHSFQKNIKQHNVFNIDMFLEHQISILEWFLMWHWKLMAAENSALQSHE